MKKQALFTLSLALLGGAATAQSLQSGYITWPGSSEFPNYVTQWKANGYTLSNTLEDENFFISRVKPKQRFRNVNTQVNTSITESIDKRLCLWVPLTTSYEGQFNLNALPNSDFDSEVFSMWSYVDVFGNWTSPHGWAPGGFADVAHKNGVSVSGVASIPYGAINTTWKESLTAQAALSSEDMAQFLYAHGVDGLGYNSEFSGYSVQTIAKQHGEIISWLEAKGHPCAEHIWYDGTTYSSSSIYFDGSLSSHNYGNFADDSGNRRASLFLNYNWTNLLSSASSYAQNKGVNPLYLYAGMNMQGGEPSTGETYPTLQSYPISLGYWGAHQFNMFWNNRFAQGSSKSTAQKTYLYDTERFFTNGAQNPAVSFSVYTQRNHYPTDAFFGMSKFMSARSTLCWDLSTEPFISYFNLGNGQFFNWNGERENDNSWYNIGVQDYLPTWRYWWAPTLLGRTVEKGNNGMNATFTWDDAYVGGSCLKITGTSTESYLHLFKTQFELKTGDVITVRYKLRNGKTDMSLAMSLVGAESTAVRESNLQVIKVDQAEDTEDWQTATFTISGALTASFNNKQVALMALHFTNTTDMELLLGEVSIKRSGTSATPAAPKLQTAKLLGNHYKGVDGKLIFNMDHSKAAGEPVYNTDVNTSLFKLYAREEGGNPVFMGITTSWAGMFYNCPFDPLSTKKVQFGVSALSLDHTAESEITWSDLFEKSTVAYSTTSDISISQTVIKPLEGFTIGYVDPKHTESTWAIYKNGTKVASATGLGISLADGSGLEEVGGYDLVIDEGTDAERRFNYYIQVSSWGVGALPRITAVTIDGKSVTSDDESVKLTLVDNATATEPVVVGYTGRTADGAASRGIEFNERFIGCNVGNLGLASGQSFSVAFWVNYASFPADKAWAILDITNRGGTWPVSNWGFCWLRGKEDGSGKIGSYTFRGYSTDGKYPGEFKYSFADTKFEAGTWAHVVITFDYASTTSFRSHLYVNGVKQASTWSRGTGGSGTGTTDTYGAKNYQVQSTDWLSIGGLPYQGNAIGGIVDDFQVWSKAMTADDVAKSMAGLDRNNLPDDVLCFWDFEEDPASDYGFSSYGKKAGVKLYNYSCEGGSNEGQGFQTPYSAIMTSGCPFIGGTAYPVTTTPSWSAKKLVLSEAQGSDTAGQAKVAFSQAGDYTLTLSLTNSYGTSTATYPVFSVTGATGIAGVDESDIKVYTVTEGLFVDLSEAGDYIITVFNAQGQLATQVAERTAGNQLMHIALNNPGAYVVKVVKDGKVVRTVKVLK